MGFRVLLQFSDLPPSVSRVGNWKAFFVFQSRHETAPWQALEGNTMIEILEAPVATDFVEKEEDRHVVYTFQGRTFRLDKEKARARLAGKRVINGLKSAELNVLPLKYHEAYRIYKQMKANHWEPDVIDMTKDCATWNSNKLNARERWIIEMGVGYFSAAEGIVGDSVLHVIEDNLTAAELKHASLRQIAEESIHMDSLLHIIGSLNIDLDEVTAKFQTFLRFKKRTLISPGTCPS
jgi:hypothetical protein